MPASLMVDWVTTWHPDASWLAMHQAHRDDLPLLFAMVEHRAWVTGVTAYLHGERTVLPPLNLQDCRFSHWMQYEGGCERHRGKSLFDEICVLHQHIHQRAGELLALQYHSGVSAVRERTPELYVLRDALLEKLMALLDSDSGSDSDSDS
jgi:hypothetical protein